MHVYSLAVEDNLPENFNPKIKNNIHELGKWRSIFIIIIKGEKTIVFIGGTCKLNKIANNALADPPKSKYRQVYFVQIYIMYMYSPGHLKLFPKCKKHAIPRYGCNVAAIGVWASSDPGRR